MLFALFAPSLRSSSKAQTNADTASAPAALNLLGCSVVAGNAPVSATMVNAARLLEFFGASLPSCPSDPEDSVHLFMGSEVPLVRSPRSDPDIHGEDGLGGVIGLPELSDPAVQRRIWASCDAHSSGNQGKFPMTSPGKLLAFWCSLLTHRIAKGLPKMTIIATGPLTNVALLLRAFPDLVNQGIEEIVIMGGTASGEKGNRGPLAGEYSPFESDVDLEVDAEQQVLPDLEAPSQSSTSWWTRKRLPSSSATISPSSWRGSMSPTRPSSPLPSHENSPTGSLTIRPWAPRQPSVQLSVLR